MARPVATTLIAVLGTLSLLGIGGATPSFLSRRLLSVQGAFWYALALCSMGGALTLVILSAGRSVIPLTIVLSDCRDHGRSRRWHDHEFHAGLHLRRGRPTFLQVPSTERRTAIATALGLALVLPFVHMSSHQQLAVVLAIWGVSQWPGDALGWLLLLRSRNIVPKDTGIPSRFSRFAVTLYPGTVIGAIGFRLDIVLLAAMAGSWSAGRRTRSRSSPAASWDLSRPHYPRHRAAARASARDCGPSLGKEDYSCQHRPHQSCSGLRTVWRFPSCWAVAWAGLW